MNNNEVYPFEYILTDAQCKILFHIYVYNVALHSQFILELCDEMLNIKYVHGITNIQNIQVQYNNHCSQIGHFLLSH